MDAKTDRTREVRDVVRRLIGRGEAVVPPAEPAEARAEIVGLAIQAVFSELSDTELATYLDAFYDWDDVPIGEAAAEAREALARTSGVSKQNVE